MNKSLVFIFFLTVTLFTACKQDRESPVSQITKITSGDGVGYAGVFNSSTIPLIMGANEISLLYFLNGNHFGTIPQSILLALQDPTTQVQVITAPHQGIIVNMDTFMVTVPYDIQYLCADNLAEVKFTLTNGDIYQLSFHLSVSGDWNSNGIIDAGDFYAIKKQWGTTNLFFDYDFDGDVDLTDFVAFRARHSCFDNIEL